MCYNVHSSFNWVTILQNHINQSELHSNHLATNQNNKPYNKTVATTQNTLATIQGYVSQKHR